VNSVEMLQELIVVQISSSGTMFVEVNILLITVISTGRRSLLQRGGSIQVDANVTYATADAPQLAGKLRPGAGWTRGFCHQYLEVGCSSITVLATCSELTPCTPPPSPVTEPVPVGIIAGVIAGGAVLFLLLLAVYWRRSGRRVMGDDPERQKAKQAWEQPSAGGTLQTPPTRGEQLLSQAGAEAQRGPASTPAALPAPQFRTPQSTDSRMSTRGRIF
jgi:hypothetical protein